MHLLGTPTYRNDIHKAMAFVSEQIHFMNSMNAERRSVSGVSTGNSSGGGRGGRGGRGSRGGRGGRGGRGRGRGRGGHGSNSSTNNNDDPPYAQQDNNSIDISARSYSDADWRSLSRNQQQRVRELRGDTDRRRALPVYVVDPRNVRARFEPPPAGYNDATTTTGNRQTAATNTNRGSGSSDSVSQMTTHTRDMSRCPRGA